MTDTPLTPERILDAAEDVLRRFGSDKANVVDVARALGVSHGSVYRHFASKTALREAVTERWLSRVSVPLAHVAAADDAPAVRLRRWLDLLVTTKRGWAHSDPELFDNYLKLAAEAGDVVTAHVDTLVAQLAQIIADGVAAGAFGVSEPLSAARAVFDATGRFHNPMFVQHWGLPHIDAHYEAVLALISAGLSHPQP